MSCVLNLVSVRYLIKPLFILLIRPLSAGLVIGVGAAALVLLLALEIARRPEPHYETPEPHDETDLIIFDLNSQEAQRLGPVPQNIFSLQWSGNDDYLLLDDGGRTSPIWALAVEHGSQVQVVIEEGTLIAAIPVPVREVALEP